MSIIVKDGNGTTQTIDTIDDLIAIVATNAKLDELIVAVGDIPGGGGGGGDASAANQVTIINALTALAGYVDGLEGKDYATQTTLAALLAKVIAAPATEAKQDTIIARAVAQLGARTVAQSPAVNLASDDPQIGTKVTAVTALGTGGLGIIGWLSQIWDRLNTSRNAGTADAGTLRAVLASDTVNANGRAAAASSAPIVLSTEDLAALSLVDDAAFTPGTSRGTAAAYLADETATDSVDEGDAGVARMTLDRKQIMTLQPHTAGGLSCFRSLDLDETEEDVKTSPGCLYKLRITNRATSPRFIKLYNAAAAAVTVGTTTPFDVIEIPAAPASDCVVLTESYGGLGLAFDTALSMAATTGFADNDTGAPGNNDVIVSAYYK